MSKSTIGRDGDFIVIRLHGSEVHSFQVAMEPVRMGDPTSKITEAFRQRIKRGIARAVAGAKGNV